MQQAKKNCLPLLASTTIFRKKSTPFKFAFMKLLSLLAALLLINPLAAEDPCPWIKDYIVKVPDFPKPGILFNCYHSLLRDPVAFKKVIQTFADRYRKNNLDAIVGLDARGFIFGGALAYELEVPFVMIRKAGKLPGKLERINYDLHYGKDVFEIESGSILPNSNILIIDDTLATGGTSQAACELIEKVGGNIIEVAFLMELSFLNGRNKLNHPVFSLVQIN